MKKPRSALIGLACAALLVGSSACVFPEDDEEPDLVEMSATVEAFDNYFKNTTVVLEPAVEATVTLVNNGSALHSFSVPDFDVELEAEGGTDGTVTFVTPNEPGAYEFFCKYHPDQMTGALTIGGDADGVPEGTETEIETEVEVEDEEQDPDY